MDTAQFIFKPWQFAAAFPLVDGWQDSVRLHQIAPMLHYCALFGRSYTASALNVARAYA